MRKKQKFLVALGEDSISMEVVKYLGQIVPGKPNLAVCLFHMLPPPPPQLREFRGAEDPYVEEELDREIDIKLEDWTRDGEAAAQPLFEKAKSILTRAGVSESSIRCISWQLLNHRDFVNDTLKAAEENACQTIVVGRSQFSRLKEAFHDHLADELVTKAAGFTIWVVSPNQPDQTESNRSSVESAA